MVFAAAKNGVLLLSATSRCLVRSCRRSTARLSEVGVLETPKAEGSYVTGQLFLHRVFGYRGIILFPWQARIYDRDAAAAAVKGTEPAPEKAVDEAPSSLSVSKDGSIPTQTSMYYQVLIDDRDCPYVRAQTESVSFLGNHESSKSLYVIPGLDYVSHTDILPYNTNQKSPIMHELFDRFLSYDAEKQPCFKSRETLQAWQDKNHPWLELSDVHRETTEDIRVTVIPFYMGSRDSQGQDVFWWRYCVRLENLGDLAVQLRERHWRIFALNGTLETVRGRGVIGREPVLSKWQPAFQFSSHVSLHSPSGHMWGTFKMEREDGFTFDCRIPPFSLESKSDSGPNDGDLGPPKTTPYQFTPPPSGTSNNNNKNNDDDDGGGSGGGDGGLPPEAGGGWGSFPFLMW